MARRRALAPDQRVQGQATGPVLVALAVPQVTQILSNLLDNAALHGQPPVTLSVDAVVSTGRLIVADEGEGMDADMLATARHRFRRSAASRSRPGFGLGLALVEGLVTGAGGEPRLCYTGRHQRFGHPYPIACRHGDEMTATVLLPTGAVRAAQTAPSLASETAGTRRVPKRLSARGVSLFILRSSGSA